MYGTTSLNPVRLLQGPVVRRVWWPERDRLTEHLLRLPADDRYRRFGGHLGDESVVAYVRDRDALRAHVIGAFVDGVLRGAAEFHMDRTAGPLEAEIALSVEPEYQGRGIGRELFRRVLLVARNRFVRRVYLTTQSDNFAMQRIARSFGMRLRPENGHVTARQRLLWPSTMSLWHEAVLEGWNLFAGTISPSIAARPTTTGRLTSSGVYQKTT